MPMPFIIPPNPKLYVEKQNYTGVHICFLFCYKTKTGLLNNLCLSKKKKNEFYRLLMVTSNVMAVNVTADV